MIIFVFILRFKDGLGNFIIVPDFLSFWAAGMLAVQGQASLAYDLNAHSLVELSALTNGENAKISLPWFNTPVFFFFIIPFTQFNYLVGCLLWGAITLCLFCFVIYVITKNKVIMSIALASPAVLYAFVQGQTSLLLTAVLGMIFYFYDKRPILAGIFISLLIIKPQLGIIFPIILLVERKWIIFISAAISTLILVIISTLFFSFESWIGFFSNLTLAKEMFLVNQTINYYGLNTLIGWLRGAGLTYHTAYFWHFLFSLAVLFFAIFVCRNNYPRVFKNIVIITSIPLISPYMLRHEYVIIILIYAYWFLLNKTHPLTKLEIGIIISSIVFQYVELGYSVGFICYLIPFLLMLVKAHTLRTHIIN